MDPASVVGLASACCSLAMKVTSTAKDLHDLRDKYASVEQNINFLISKLDLVGSSVSSLSRWLDDPSRLRLANDSEDSLRSSLKFCTIVVDGLNVHISSVKQEHSRPGPRGRVRYLWNEDTINEHIRKLDSQINSLSLHLHVIQLTKPEKAASFLQAANSVKIFKRARDDASTCRQGNLHQDEDACTEFDFDDSVVRSGPYVDHFRAMMRKSRRNTSSRDSLMLAGDAIHTTDPQQDQLPPIEEPHEIAPAKPKSFGRGLRHKGTRLFAALRVSGDDRREHGKSLLIVASQGNVDRIQQLIDAGGDPNYKAKEDDESALHKAARAGHSEAISVLLTSLAKLNAKNKIGETPLHLASGVAVGPVRVLVNADARVDLSDLDGWTALHNAAVWGLPDVLEVLVKAGAPVNAKSKGGHTALHQACYSDSSECVRILLESDAWVDAKAGTTKRNCGFYDATPLHMACYMATQKIEFDIAIIRLLIEAGADLNAKTESGKNGREITPLHIAARGRRADIVQLLIDSGADFDARAPVSMRIIWADDLQIWDDYNVIYTPLHFAVAFNSTPTIATLLKAGASGATDTGDRWEWQLLHTAALHGAVASATCLLRETETLRINTRHLVGTPLHIAASKGYSAIALLLLEHGADVNSRGNKKRTPLHRVLTARATNNSKSLESSIKINSRFYPLVTLLLDYGADVNAIDEDGETPLSMLLCPRSKSLWKHRSVDHDFAKALLEGGADIQGSKSTKGDLITQAWVRRDGSLMEFLIKHGATITKDLYNKAWRDAVTAKGYKPVNSYRGHDPHILHQARRKFEQVKESYSKRCTLLDAYAEADVASYGQSLVSEESNRIGNLTRKEKERRNQKEREIEEFNEMQEAGLNGLKYERRRENRRDAVTRAKERGSLAVPPPKNVKRRKPRKSASSDSIDVNLSNESES